MQGVKAIHSPHTGIVDWGEVTRSYCRNFTKMGGDVVLGREVSSFETATENPEYPVVIRTKNKVRTNKSHVPYSHKQAPL